MIDKLEAFSKKYEELSKKLCDPSVVTVNELYTKTMKEYKEVEPVALKYNEYKKIALSIEDNKKLLEENRDDDELKALLTEEQNELEKKKNTLSEELKELLVPKDENDDRNVIVEIRAGAGGEEAALFAGVVYRMYTMYAQNNGFTLELLNINETELGGIKAISFMVSGRGAYSRFKFESGVHRVQRVPETETQGRIHTSTVSVAVLPEAEEVEVNIDPSDLKIDTFRSSGAGGQHINKTESAIRITHIPTGIVVECQDERSQYKNKDKAMKVLRSRLLESEKQKQHDKQAKERASQVGTADRSERIRTYNYHEGRVTDHRIGLVLYKIDEILNGNLDEFVDALTAAQRAEKIRSEQE